VTGSALAGWTAIAALLTITPGVDMALVARSAVVHGLRPALWTTGGIVSGLLVWGGASAVGIAALLAASASAYDALRLAGAAYLIVLGVRALWRSRSAPATPDTAPGVPRARRSAYLTGLANNVANPKIVVFYSTVMPGFIPHGAPVLTWSLAFAAIHAALGVAWLSGYALVLHRARGVLARPRMRQAVDRITGAVLVGLGLRLALGADHS
jgi:threonine/homoserine/homoserine lactone efflux protein